MSNPILFKTFAPPPLCEKEILRYAGMKGEDKEISELLKSCLKEARHLLSYKVCYREFPLKISGDICSFEDFSLESQKLAKNLEKCDKAIIFAATIGVGIDRLIAKYSKLSPARALILEAIGSERIEALCDAFSSDFGAPTRFSPGYGDLGLEAQKTLFSLLEPIKIGLSLNDSLIMSPSKSVTAIMGIGKKPTRNKKCSLCEKTDCEYRA